MKTNTNKKFRDQNGRFVKSSKNAVPASYKKYAAYIDVYGHVFEIKTNSKPEFITSVREAVRDIKNMDLTGKPVSWNSSAPAYRCTIAVQDKYSNFVSETTKPKFVTSVNTLVRIVKDMKIA